MAGGNQKILPGTFTYTLAALFNKAIQDVVGGSYFIGAIREAGFGLFDIGGLHWLSDRTLGWFYPVYLNHKADGIRRRSFWDEENNAKVIQAQVDRRKRILESNAASLAHLRAAREA